MALRRFALFLILCPLATVAKAQFFSLGYGTTGLPEDDDGTATYLGLEMNMSDVYLGFDIPSADSHTYSDKGKTFRNSPIISLRSGYYLFEMNSVDIGFGSSFEFYEQEVLSGKTTNEVQSALEVTSTLRVTPSFRGYARATSGGIVHLGLGYGF